MIRWVVAVVMLLSLVAFGRAIYLAATLGDVAGRTGDIDFFGGRLLGRDVAFAVLSGGVWVCYDQAGREVGRLPLVEE